jgi:hypothetical protein
MAGEPYKVPMKKNEKNKCSYFGMGFAEHCQFLIGRNQPIGHSTHDGASASLNSERNVDPKSGEGLKRCVQLLYARLVI